MDEDLEGEIEDGYDDAEGGAWLSLLFPERRHWQSFLLHDYLRLRFDTV